MSSSAVAPGVRLKEMCRGRGLAIARMDPHDDLLLPPEGTPEVLKGYRELLDRYAARLLLKEIIKSETSTAWNRGRRLVERFCDPRSVDAYLDQFQGFGVVDTHEGFPRPARDVRSFGQTYEWYAAQVLSTDFLCPAAWGVLFPGMDAGGDHDVVASLSGRFLYMEVKTAPPKHVDFPEVNGFIRRLADLSPDIAIFHEDTHLRMKDKIVPLLEEAVLQFGGRAAARDERNLFERLEREIFHLEGAVYVVNSKPDLRRNLEVVFRHHFRHGNRVLGALGGV